MIDPAEATCPAPQRLIDWLAARGFAVELRISRAEEMTIDSGAYPPDIDEPITDDDLEYVAAMMVAYDASEPWDPPAPEEQP